jgi:LysR family transcriptional regulator, glycine cleavage system transcriptional activator
MKRQLPPLTALRAFEAVGRLNSMRAAGDELGVNHTVISGHVRHLEEHIGTNLIEPKGRGIVLTPRGVHFHDKIRAAFAEILRATLEASPSHRRSVEVWCMPGIAVYLMSFLLKGLKSDFSGIEVSFPLEHPHFRPHIASCSDRLSNGGSGCEAKILIIR